MSQHTRSGVDAPTRNRVRARNTHRFRRLCCAVVVATGTTALAAANASATEGTSIDLSTGPSGEANIVDILASDAQAMVYSVSDPQGPTDQTYLRLADGTTTPLPEPFDALSYPTLVGSTLGIDDTSNHQVVYRSIDDPITTPSGAAPLPTGANFLSISADGFLYDAVSTDDATLHLYDDNVTVGSTTDLGLMPGSSTDYYVVSASTAGLALVDYPEGSATVGVPQLYYLDPSAPGQFRPIGSYIRSEAVSISADSVTWLENPTITLGEDGFDESQTTIVRLNLADGTKVRASAPGAGTLATTPSLTSFIDDNGTSGSQEFVTMPATGGTMTRYPGLTALQVASFGASFAINFAGTPQTAGIYTTSSAADTPTQIVPAGAATYRAEAVALAPNRAAWIDNGVGADVWTAPLTTSGADLTVGMPRSVSPSAYALSGISGNRTMYADPGSLVVQQAGHPDQTVPVPAGTTTLSWSGTRLLALRYDGSGAVYDIRTGQAVTTIPAISWPFWFGLYQPQSSALWGNELASMASDGSVSVLNLVSGVRTEVSAPLITPGAGEAAQGRVEINGHTVAWGVSVCQYFNEDHDAITCSDPTVEYRDFTSSAAPTVIPTTLAQSVTLSDGYVAYENFGPGVDNQQLHVRQLYTSTETDLGAVGSFDSPGTVALSGSTVAWIGDDGLAHAQALPHVAAQPWYLGNGIAPSGLVADGSSSWDGDFVASEALTTCAVTISSGATVVRVLNCDATQTPYGEAEVSWDGRDATGDVVSPGNYTWTLSGANTDGPLLDADGATTPITGDIQVTAVAAPGGGGGSGASDGSGSGSGAAGGGGSGSGTDGTPQPVSAGGSVWSGGTTPTKDQPISVGVTSPVAGQVTITSAPDDAPHPGNHGLKTVVISAPQASAAQPLTLTFEVDLSDLPAGSFPSDVQIFRDGAAIAACASPTAVTANPDPCVKTSTVQGNVATFQVLSSHASTWQLESADVSRLAGVDRFGTAAATSQAAFADDAAGAVVLARSDDYADALVGAPLAAAKNAPLLLTTGNQLPTATKQELLRVLKTGGTVYVLGSTAAIPASVETQLQGLGYHTTRLAGSNRFGTAVAVADALGDPGNVLLATGANYPDALAAGPAASHVAGAVLLTNGTSVPPETAAYLAAHATKTYAIGGPATQADPSAIPISGKDRYATAIAVASTFFGSATSVGVVTGENFPDALAAGAVLAKADSPLLLTSGSSLSPATRTYLSGLGSSLTQIHLFGGPKTISDQVQTALAAMLGH